MFVQGEYNTGTLAAVPYFLLRNSLALLAQSVLAAKPFFFGTYVNLNGKNPAEVFSELREWVLRYRESLVNTGYRGSGYCDEAVKNDFGLVWDEQDKKYVSHAHEL